MSSIYRGAQPPLEDDEPLPDLSCPDPSWRHLANHTALVLVTALALRVFADETEALKFLFLCLPGVVVFALLCALWKPVRRWRAERAARNLVRGIADLEARAARL